MCRLPYELMQTIRPNSGLNYQSLDSPYHFCCTKLPDRIFKYRHTFKSKTSELEIKIGDSIEPNSLYWIMSMRGHKRDGFLNGYLMNKGVYTQYLHFPPYKTVEKYVFYDEQSFKPRRSSQCDYRPKHLKRSFKDRLKFKLTKDCNFSNF
jgi:hypothetical protein